MERNSRGREARWKPGVEVLLQLRLLQFLHHALQIGELLPALFQLLRQDALRRLGLGILLEVAGGVLLRRQQRIQTDIQLGAALLVVVLRRQAGHAPLHAVEVGGDELTGQPQRLPVPCGGVLLLLKGRRTRSRAAVAAFIRSCPFWRTRSACSRP